MRDGAIVERSIQHKATKAECLAAKDDMLVALVIISVAILIHWMAFKILCLY